MALEGRKELPGVTLTGGVGGVGESRGGGVGVHEEVVGRARVPRVHGYALTRVLRTPGPVTSTMVKGQSDTLGLQEDGLGPTSTPKGGPTVPDTGYTTTNVWRGNG